MKPLDTTERSKLRAVGIKGREIKIPPSKNINQISEVSRTTNREDQKRTYPNLYQ